MSELTSKTFGAFIKPQGAEGTVHSKFVLEGAWLDPETEISVRWTYNINSDVSVPAFNSPDALDKPPVYALSGTGWVRDSQFTGYDSFSGTFGEGRIYIKTGKGLVIKGPIVGGPDAGGQRFVEYKTFANA